VEGAGPIRALFGTLRWRNQSLDPLLLRGKLVISQVGGALSWRSHSWLTGGAQNGKTTLLARGLSPLMPFSFGTFGPGTTEAGIRQSLGGDSLPWIYDEAEQSSGLSNIYKIIGMLRGNTSGSAGERTAKGTIHGQALTFDLCAAARCCARCAPRQTRPLTCRVYRYWN
jgi:hypothetical protein